MYTGLNLQDCFYLPAPTLSTFLFLFLHLGRRFLAASICSWVQPRR